jgi:hypothetical protein
MYPNAGWVENSHDKADLEITQRKQILEFNQSHRQDCLGGIDPDMSQKQQQKRDLFHRSDNSGDELGKRIRSGFKAPD